MGRVIELFPDNEADPSNARSNKPAWTILGMLTLSTVLGLGIYSAANSEIPDSEFIAEGTVDGLDVKAAVDIQCIKRGVESAVVRVDARTITHVPRRGEYGRHITFPMRPGPVDCEEATNNVISEPERVLQKIAGDIDTIATDILGHGSATLATSFEEQLFDGKPRVPVYELSE